MKKVVSVLLAMLMVFSCFGVMAFAEDGEQVEVRVEYLKLNEEGKAETFTTKTKLIDKGAEISSAEMQEWLYDMPREFSEDYEVTEDGYTRTETKTYTFKGFVKAGDESGQLYYFGSTGEINENTVFVAQYVIKDTIDTVTFWELVQSIFARINRIFEYFNAIFNFDD